MASKKSQKVEDMDQDLRPVMLPSGGLFKVHDSEVSWFDTRRAKYLSDNHFTNISDQQDLDRVLTLELLIWRWGIWLSQKMDYWGDAIDENATQKALKDHSAEVRQLKKSLGLDKESRDKQRGEGSVAHYLENLRARAKHFGYARNQMASKSIELFQQLKALIVLHDNCDEQERFDQKITQEDLLKWIRETAIPEFDAIDEKFREEEQRYWIREQ